LFSVWLPVAVAQHLKPSKRVEIEADAIIADRERAES